MGWSAGYTIFEATVVGAYDLGKLDKALLTVLMEPYRNTDIDSGGCQDLESKDGKMVDQIVIETWGLEMPKMPDKPQSEDEEAWENYEDEVYEKMQSVRKHFGW